MCSWSRATSLAAQTWGKAGRKAPRSPPAPRVHRNLGGTGRRQGDSAAFTGAVRAAGAFFSVTVRMDPKVKGRDRGHPGNRLDPYQIPPRSLG